MSEKRQRNIKYPSYDLASMYSYLETLCKSFSFERDRLVSLIFADWISTFQSSLLQGVEPYKAFLAYLETTEFTFKRLNDIRSKVMESVNESGEK